MAKAESIYKRVCNEMKETPILTVDPAARNGDPLNSLFMDIAEHATIMAACIIAEAIANCGNTEG